MSGKRHTVSPRLTPDQQAEFDRWFDDAYPKAVAEVRARRYYPEVMGKRQRPKPKPIEVTHYFLVVRDHLGNLRRIPLTDTFYLNYRKPDSFGVSNLRFDVAAIVARKSDDIFGDNETSMSFEYASATVEIEHAVVFDAPIPGLHPLRERSW